MFPSPSNKHTGVRRSGSALVLMAVAFVFVIAMAALAIDFGWTYVEEGVLQRALDAAVVAAATELQDSGSQDQSRIAARTLASANGIDLADSDIHFDPFTNNTQLVEISHILDVGLFFAPALGATSIPVPYRVYGLSRFNFPDPPEPEQASGLIPLAIPHADLIGVLTGTITTREQLAAAIFDEPGDRFSRGQLILLKAGQSFRTRMVSLTSAGASNQGALDLPGDGNIPTRFQTLFRLGYGGLVSIGDRLATEAGTMSGQTRDANEYRFDQDPEAVLDAGPNQVKPFSARLVLVPIVTAVATGPLDMGTGVSNLRHLLYMHEGRILVEVIGFARVLLSDYAMDLGQGVVTGRFAGYVGTPPIGQGPG